MNEGSKAAGQGGGDIGAIVDLRSDTVTRPTAGMRAAMAAAPLGDDVFGDDPSVNALQAALAERLGSEAALFMPTGTQSNLCALMAHCQRGDEYLVGQFAHTYRWEGGGAAVLGSIQPQPLNHAPDGSLPLADIEANIKPDDAHFARTRLLALENTIGGKVLPMVYLAAASGLAQRHGLSRHLDGARLSTRPSPSPRATRAIRTTRRSASARTSTACRSASPRAWARRSARCCAARANSSNARTAGARCSAAACARRGCSRRRRIMRSITR